MEIALRIIGVFYVLGCVLLVRSLAVDGMTSKLEKMVYGQQLKDRIRHVWLRVGAALTLASGLTLVLLGPYTMPILYANAIAQGGWLLYARSHFPPEDADDARGRQQTMNAFIGFGALTLLVGWAVMSGHVVLSAPGTADLWQGLRTWLPVAGGVVAFIGMMVG